MKKVINIILLPFKWVAYLFLQLLIRMFDDYNANFKKYNL
jgi:hypothetical protein